MSRSVAVFGIVFGAQTVPWMLGQLHQSYALWVWIVAPVLFGTLVVALILAFAKVWVRQSQGLFALLYLAALISWPFALLPGADVDSIHWLYYLLTVATGMAAIAFNTMWGVIYLVAAPLIYLVFRASPAGGSAAWQLATLEAVYAVILGGAIMIIVTMLRVAASSVDAAQATALDRYGYAVRQHATEVERVRVDAIVHDSVLTTLISAARAYTPQAKQLAATMADSAIGYLREAAMASPDESETVRMAALAARITETSGTLSPSIRARVEQVGTRSIPAPVAEAIYSATVQAMINSLQHAGEDDLERWVVVRGLAEGGLETVIGDAGAGFRVDAVLQERIGVRISIIERIANAGGEAQIRSAPGNGTVVTIRWPVAPAVDADPEIEEVAP